MDLRMRIEAAACFEGVVFSRSRLAAAAAVPTPRPVPIPAGTGGTGPLETGPARAAACTACPLHAGRRHAVYGEGNPRADLMFVGEGPGADEDRVGRPFVGEAGKLLDRMIAAMGFTREDVYIANVVKCRPPQNRTPLPDEIAACRPFLDEQIAAVAPRVMVALGAPAARTLLETDEGITRLRGRAKDRGGILVMPTFHPAYILRNRGTPRWESSRKEVWQDLKEVMAFLAKTAAPPAPLNVPSP